MGAAEPLAVGLLGEVQAAKEKTRRGCRVAEVKALLGEESSELEMVVADRSVPIALIQQVVANRDIILGYKSIARHRRGECGCPQ